MYGHPGAEILRPPDPAAVLRSRLLLQDLLAARLVGLALPLTPEAAVLHGVVLRSGPRRVEIDHLVRDPRAGEVKGWAGPLAAGPDGCALLRSDGPADRRPAMDQGLAVRVRTLRRLAWGLFGQELPADSVHALGLGRDGAGRSGSGAPAGGGSRRGLESGPLVAAGP